MSKYYKIVYGIIERIDTLSDTGPHILDRHSSSSLFVNIHRTDVYATLWHCRLWFHLTDCPDIEGYAYRLAVHLALSPDRLDDTYFGSLLKRGTQGGYYLYRWQYRSNSSTYQLKPPSPGLQDLNWSHSPNVESCSLVIGCKHKRGSSPFCLYQACPQSLPAPALPSSTGSPCLCADHPDPLSQMTEMYIVSNPHHNSAKSKSYL